jgi:hypothetical protein
MAFDPTGSPFCLEQSQEVRQQFICLTYWRWDKGHAVDFGFSPQEAMGAEQTAVNSAWGDAAELLGRSIVDVSRWQKQVLKQKNA